MKSARLNSHCTDTNPYCTDSTTPHHTDTIRQLKTLFLAAYRWLRCQNKSKYLPKLRFLSFAKAYLDHEDGELRCLALHVIQDLYECCDAEIQQLFQLYLDETDHDGPLFALREAERLVQEQSMLYHQDSTHRQDSTPPKNTTPSLLVLSTDLCDKTVDICGVLTANWNPAAREPVTDLILTTTTVHNLGTIAMSLSMNSPILLYGPHSAGKSHLISCLARKTGQRLVTLHLTDTTDAKSLLGSYVCTDRPGEFQFQSGVLTKAAQKGHWLLIEDIDMAPDDLVTVLASILERREILVGGGNGEKVVCADEFRVFATVTSSSKHLPRLPLLNASLWTQLCVKPLSSEEVRQVVYQRFSDLPSIVADLILVGFETLEHAIPSLPFKIRPVSLRDLMKWCRRMEILGVQESLANGSASQVGLSPEVCQSIYMEAFDLFFGSIPDPVKVQQLAAILAGAMGIPDEFIPFLLQQRTVNLHETNEQLSVGRIALSKIHMQSARKTMTSAVEATKSKFALTNHALRLLERLLCSIHPELQEPLLLVGETGKHGFW